MIQMFAQSVRMAITALLSNKGRSFLTMLGIIIGVSAVIIIVSIGAGAQSMILSQIEDLGTNLVGVMPGYSEEGSPPTSVMGIVITTLTYEDAMALGEKRNVPNIVEAVAYYKSVGTVTWRSESYDTNLNGVSAGYLDVEGGEIEKGRFFTEEEERTLGRVAILGSAVRDELFGPSEAIGQKVKIENQAFEVIGVMEERGVVAMQDYDDQVFVPVRTMQKLVAGVNHLGLIRAKVDSEDNINAALEDIRAVLRERHDIRDSSGAGDDFTVRSATQALEMITSITDGLRFFLAGMAALSLIVGGVGIMNIMLISVAERTREIGLRKAIGADNLHVFIQFLAEAITITVLSGALGVVGGILISYLISLGVQFAGFDWEFIVSPFSVGLALSVSLFVGLLFGMYPASKASRLDPIDALRYE
ncbi:multidrug ABC transporter substrate-binding protein [bacterium]|nr:multidrug ABC transporter substrate-binding protein [bacterium]